MSAIAAAVEATHGLSLDWNTADPVEVRRHIRTGEYRGHTGALARGFVQANLAILPEAYAAEFARFCQRNPKPCPLLAMSEPGDPRLPELGHDLDLRTDVPSYRVFRDGELDGDVRSIGDLWQDDFVAFALGCSFSFEEPWSTPGSGSGIGRTGACARCFSPTSSARRRAGSGAAWSCRCGLSPPRTRSRRCRSRADIPRCTGRRYTSACRSASASRTSSVRGRATIRSSPRGEMPLFWACGVTPQVAVRSARPPIAITHTPAHMLVTDVRNASLAVG